MSSDLPKEDLNKIESNIDSYFNEEKEKIFEGNILDIIGNLCEPTKTKDYESTYKNLNDFVAGLMHYYQLCQGDLLDGFYDLFHYFTPSYKTNEFKQKKQKFGKFIPYHYKVFTQYRAKFTSMERKFKTLWCFIPHYFLINKRTKKREIVTNMTEDFDRFSIALFDYFKRDFNIKRATGKFSKEEKEFLEKWLKE